MDILSPNTQDQLFSSIAAILEPDSGTGADRKPTTKKIAATLERARDFHRVAEASQRDLRASLLSPLTKADELPAMRLQHDGYGFLIERLAPLIVSLNERLSTRNALEAREARAVAQGNARVEFDKAMAHVSAELRKLGDLASALDAAETAYRECHGLEIAVADPGSVFGFGGWGGNHLRPLHCDLSSSGDFLHARSRCAAGGSGTHQTGTDGGGTARGDPRRRRPSTCALEDAPNRQAYADDGRTYRTVSRRNSRRT